MERISFRDEMARNKRSSILLAASISAILVALVYVLVSLLAPEYLVLALPIAVVLIALNTYGSYRYGDSVVLAATKARPAEL